MKLDTMAFIAWLVSLAGVLAGIVWASDTPTGWEAFAAWSATALASGFVIGFSRGAGKAIDRWLGRR